MSLYNTNIYENVRRKDFNVVKKMQTNEHHYIFYFFTYFKPSYEFLLYSVTGEDWGRYDIISKKQYETDMFYWVIQLFDTKRQFWDMEYNYVLYIPHKSDIINYINFINRNILIN